MFCSSNGMSTFCETALTGTGGASEIDASALERMLRKWLIDFSSETRWAPWSLHHFANGRIDIFKRTRMAQIVPLAMPIDVKLSDAYGHYQNTPRQRLESPPPSSHAPLSRAEQQRQTQQ